MVSEFGLSSGGMVLNAEKIMDRVKMNNGVADQFLIYIFI